MVCAFRSVPSSTSPGFVNVPEVDLDIPKNAAISPLEMSPMLLDEFVI